MAIRLYAYRELVANASQLAHRVTRTEIKIISTINVKEIQKSADAFGKELRLLDNKLQEMNWKTELQ